MTAPRQLLRGSSYHVTRRCVGRLHLLKPTSLTNQILGYVLARAASRSGVVLHAYCFMSNHHHLVLTDPEARLPAFMEDLDSLISRAINASYGRWGYFPRWPSERTRWRRPACGRSDERVSAS